MLYSVQRVNSLLAINWTAISINSDSCYTHHCQFLSWLGLKKQFPHCLSTDSIGVCFLRSLYSSAKKKTKKKQIAVQISIGLQKFISGHHVLQLYLFRAVSPQISWVEYIYMYHKTLHSLHRCSMFDHDQI